jgi:hypothetical protein
VGDWLFDSKRGAREILRPFLHSSHVIAQPIRRLLKVRNLINFFRSFASLMARNRA